VAAHTDWLLNYRRQPYILRHRKMTRSSGGSVIDEALDGIPEKRTICGGSVDALFSQLDTLR